MRRFSMRRVAGALVWLVVVAGLGATTSGCMIVMGASVAAPSTVPLEPGEYAIVHHPAKGEAKAYNLFGIPLSSPDTVKRARDEAMARTLSDALVNVSVSVEVKNILGFLTVTTTYVEGDGVRILDPERKVKPAKAVESK